MINGIMLVLLMIVKASEFIDCFEDACYGRSPASSWDNAVTYCKELGWNLASVHSSEENDYIVINLFTEIRNRYWIGLNDVDNEGVFINGTWSDGTVVNYTNWQASIPSYFSFELSYMNQEGDWNAAIVNPLNLYPGICKRWITSAPTATISPTLTPTIEPKTNIPTTSSTTLPTTAPSNALPTPYPTINPSLTLKWTVESKTPLYEKEWFWFAVTAAGSILVAIIFKYLNHQMKKNALRVTKSRWNQLDCACCHLKMSREVEQVEEDLEVEQVEEDLEVEQVEEDLEVEQTEEDWQVELVKVE